MGSRAIIWKLFILAAVTLILGIVLLRIGWLVDERQGRQQEAVLSVEQAQAGAQTLLGPLLQRRCVEEWESVTGQGAERRVAMEKREFTLVAAPAKLQVGGTLKQEARYRGLFKVNGYAGDLLLEAQWASVDALQPKGDHAGSKLQCADPELMLAVSDARGLRAAELSMGAQSLAVRPGTRHPNYERGLHAVLPLPLALPVAVQIKLELQGTGRFALVPAAASTKLNLKSDWPHPSFGGRFLPSERAVDAAGFTAQWNVSELASTAAADVLARKAMPDVGSSGPERTSEIDTLEVAFVDPVNPYVMSDRAIKYGMLFILLTFVCVGLVELLAGRRVHPVQYLMVGMALSVFFLLLLSLSEHLSFGLSYGLASGAAVALLSYYGVAMLGTWARGLGFGTLVAGLYAALYTLLRLEQAALVIGALLLFALLAAVMTLTRKLDWYSLGAGTTPVTSTR